MAVQRKKRRRRKFRKEFLILVWSVVALLVIIPLAVHLVKKGKADPSKEESSVSQTDTLLPAESDGEATDPDTDESGSSEGAESAVDEQAALAAKQLAAGKETIAAISEKVAQMGETDAEFSIAAEEDLPYLVAVNRAGNCVTVYIADEEGNYTQPYRAMVCSTGETGTPLGVWKLPTQEESLRSGVRDLWHLMDGNVYGQYTTRITWNDGILFHSVPYYTNGDNNSLESEEYNKLGSYASLGCIRMAVVDAKWIMENCPFGTTVVIYDDADNPGPLGKPEGIQIDLTDETTRGWDPTDPDPANPWGDTYLEGTAIYAAGVEKLA